MNAAQVSAEPAIIIISGFMVDLSDFVIVSTAQVKPPTQLQCR
jgi:hypothetical protein